MTCSYEVSPEFREYERTVTTVVNAYLRPVCRAVPARASATAAGDGAGDDLGRRAGAGRRRRRAPGRAAAVGPGRRACAPAPRVAAANGFPDAITFDMGGTRTDVCLVLDGRPEPAAEREVAGLPVRLPSLDVHTIGAGGGSIARIDAGGALVVGPAQRGRRARARPATAAVATEPTVTDADLVAGRIPADAALPRARRARPSAPPSGRSTTPASTAEGVLAVVDAAMEQALRAVSVERGVDPRGLALVAFGGAGPLHACALADALGHAGGDRAGPGRRAVARSGSSAPRCRSTSCGRGPTRSITPPSLDERPTAIGARAARRRRAR